MRLLFDQNLSRRLVSRLSETFPGSAHVSELDFSRADDAEVWTAAKVADYTIVSKDSDFNALVLLRGYPPHVIWIRRGNCTTDEIEVLLRQKRSEIEALPSITHGVLELR